MPKDELDDEVDPLAEDPPIGQMFQPKTPRSSTQRMKTTRTSSKTRKTKTRTWRTRGTSRRAAA